MEQPKKHGIVRRGAGGLGKAWAYSLGFTGLYNTGKRIAGNLSDAGAHVRRKLNDSPENYRHETFEEAVERLGLDEAHLVRQARDFNIRAFSWLTSMVLATLWMMWAPWSDSPVSHFILCLGLMIMSFSKFISWRFRACQIRDRELFSFGPWIRNPGRW